MKEHCLTSGSRDRSVRLWKIVEESQLIFRTGAGTTSSDFPQTQEKIDKRNKMAHASGGSVDAIAMIDEENFLSGSDSGSISLWNSMRKKPVYTRLNCHGKGIRETNGEVGADTSYCNWITCLATVPYCDLFASGSCDGFIRVWKIAETKKSFDPLFSIAMVNIYSFPFFYFLDWIH